MLDDWVEEGGWIEERRGVASGAMMSAAKPKRGPMTIRRRSKTCGLVGCQMEHGIVLVT